MSRTVTLTLLRDDIRFQADLIGATVRHTDAQLTRLVNQSIQEFREAISNEGNTHYLVAYSGTLSTGATSPYSFLSLDLSGISPSIVRTYKFEITVDGVVHKLNHRPFNDDNVWGGPSSRGIPAEWSHYQTAKLAIHPPPESAYAYTLWYLPVFTDLSADGDTFDGVSGWEAWIVWDVVCRLLIRDQQGSAFASAKLYRDDVWSRIQRNATKVSHAGGAVVGRDTLRGRIPDFLAAKQAVMAGGGPPASGSVTLDMMADMTGPAVLGRISGTGRPTVVGGSAVAQSILPAFGPTWKGLVPAAGGSSTSMFLSQAGTFETVSAGGGGGSPGGPSGSIQFAGLSGFVGYTGFSVQGQPPSMTVRLPGSLRVTGGTVDVGSGTVRISESGIAMGVGNIRFGTPQSPSGLIAAPGDDVSLIVGLKSDSVGHANILSWNRDSSPERITIGGSGIKDLHYYAGDTSGNGGHSWFTDVGGVTPAMTLTQDNPAKALLGITGNLSASAVLVGSGISNDNLHPMGSDTVKGRLSPTGAPQDIPIPTLLARIPTFTSAAVGVVPPSGGGTTNFLRADGGWAVPPGSAGTPTGVTNAQLANMPSGTVKANLSGTAAPADVVIPTLMAFFPTFSDVRVGLVPPSGGGTTNFLRADGSWNAPPAAGTPTGITLAQFNPINSPRILGRISTGSGVPEEIVPTLIATLLPHFTDTGRGMVPLSGGGTANYLRADATFNAPSGAHQFPPAAGVTNEQLATVPSGTVKGRLTAGVPGDLIIPTLMAFFPTFSDVRVGLVPPSGGGVVNFLRADGNFAAPTGFASTPTGLPNANLAVMPSGTVKANITGTGVPADVLIPTLFMYAPTMTSSRAGIVGPGGGTLTNFLRGDGAFAAPTGFVSTPTGVPNSQLAVMPSGTVKANLTGTGVPADVLIPSLMMHFPTFTDARVGLVPPSGGGTSNFLRADGGWAVPPGGAASPGGGLGNFQFNNGVGFDGASGVNVAGSGIALAFGPLAAGSGDIRGGSGFSIQVRNPSGITQPVVEWVPASGMMRFGGSGLPRLDSAVASGGVQSFTFGGATSTTARLLPTGFDLTGFHIKAKSIDVEHINGLPANSNNLKRGANIIVASGLSLFAPRGAPTGANRYIVPSGIVTTGFSILLRPTGARAGEVIRIERIDSSGFAIDIKTPTGTTLHSMPSGTKAWADFMYSKPSGANFELAGHADMF